MLCCAFTFSPLPAWARAFSRTLLLVFGLGSMCLAAPFILVQTNLKRLLAYSSLEHVGLICVGFGLNSRVTIWGALLHMGYHALTKPVLFFAAGNIHQTCHTLQMRLIGPGMAKMLPATVVCMGLAAVAATGLPPFGLFFSEMTVLNGGFAAGHWIVSTIVLVALLGAFCGILYQLTRIMLGVPKVTRTSDAAPLDGVPAMGLMLGALLVFSVWLPAPLLFVMQRAAGIIGGEPVMSGSRVVLELSPEALHRGLRFLDSLQGRPNDTDAPTTVPLRRACFAWRPVPASGGNG